MTGVQTCALPISLTFTNLAPGVVGSGLLGDGSRAWTASSSALQAWDVASGKLLHDLPADAEAMKSALWMKGDGSEAWVARAWVGGRLGLRALGIEASTVSVEEPEWQPVPRYSGALDLSFSADGTRIVLADVANGVRVHAVPSMEVVRRMPGVAARRAELSPTGSRIAATTSDGKVWTWGIGSGVTHAWTADVPQAQEVAFSPDGQRVLAGTLDGKVVVLDGASGRVLARLGPLGVAVLALAMDAGGTRVAAGMSDGRVVFLDPVAGDLVGTLRPGMGAVQGVRFLGRDGLAVAGTAGVRVHPHGTE